MTEILVPAPRPQLIVNRAEYTDQTTIGDFLIDKVFECHTLEDTCRVGKDGILQADEKIPGETAIPAGIYRLILSHSLRFGFCPEILEVPFFSGIRIHCGNKAADTRGCILVGKTKGPDWVGESRVAHKALMEKLAAMNQKEKLWIEVIGGIPKEEFKAAA